MALTITHTAVDGTLLDGSSKGDGAWDAIKAAQATYQIRGWRYMPSIRAIGVSHSRDRAPNLGLIDRTADVLREAGFEVQVEIDGAPRRMEDAEADRADRMDDRAAALTTKSGRLADESDSRYTAAQQIADGIPMGQPVLVGHHSERGHRRDLKRMDGHMRKSVEAAAESTTAAERAAAAERHMQARNNPRRVYRRIETLEADLRRQQRHLDGYTTRHLDGHGNPVYEFDHAPADGRSREQCELEVAHLSEQIRYWREALDTAKADGAWVPIDLVDVQKGDWIKAWPGWKRVVRVNKKSVSVEDSWGEGRPTFTRVVKLDEIKEHRRTPPWEPTSAEVAVDLDALDAAAAEEADRAPEPASVYAPVPARNPSGLSEAALEVLRNAGATEQSVHLAGVPESRDVFTEVDKWLRHLPGFRGYDSRERAYTHSRDPRPALQELTGVEPVRPASGEHDKALAYYRTPDMTARMMAAELGVTAGDTVLEPSAGDGALVLATLTFHPRVYVHAVEVDRARAQLLRNRFGAGDVTVHQQRFQEFAEDDTTPFDAVVMNPPFTEPGDRQAWTHHFHLAWSLLKPGGRMVAILPSSYRYSTHQAAGTVRDLVEASSGVVVDLPEGTFEGGGTGVHAVMVSVTKRAPELAEETATQPATAQESPF